MFCKVFFCLFFIVGLVSAAAVEKTIENKSDADLPAGFGTPHDYTSYVVDDSSYPYSLVPGLESTSLLTKLFQTAVAYKHTALAIAVKVIGWVIKNIVVIVIGAIATIGFCKFTDKCSFDHKYFDDVANYRSLVTPERLASAEKFLMTAVEKYATEMKQEKLKAQG